MKSELFPLADTWLERLRVRGFAKDTLGVYASILRAFLARLEGEGIGDPLDITPDLVEGYFIEESQRTSRYGKPLAPLSIEHIRTVLSGFFQYLVRREILLGNPMEGLCLGKAPIRFRRPPSRRALSRLLDAPGFDPVGLRDRAIFETFYSSGIRRAELCGLDLTDVDRASGSLFVRQGKGGKDRIVPIGEKALQAVGVYLIRGRPALDPIGPALFVSRLGIRFPKTSLNLLFREYNARLGLDPPITPHLLRHAFATGLLENGASVRHVQAMLGHSKLDSTAIYTHVGVRRLQEKMALLDHRGRLESHAYSSF